MSLLKRIRKTVGRGRSSGFVGPAGARAYAVGDIHGRLDLLNALLRSIEEDMAQRAPARTFIIFLGDYIDRGPDSAGVIERLRTYQPHSAKLVFLGGNHEEVLLKMLNGERGIFESWLKYGGAEFLRSYDLHPEELRRLSEDEALKIVRQRLPDTHRDFVKDCADSFRFGDYLFAHAGIRPGVPLDEQEISDLRWIREPFLESTDAHGFLVVHGHTIVPKIDERENRIGIDTGAYKTGILTAIGLEGSVRWYLATRGIGQS